MATHSLGQFLGSGSAPVYLVGSESSAIEALRRQFHRTQAGQALTTVESDALVATVESNSPAGVVCLHPAETTEHSGTDGSRDRGQSTLLSLVESVVGTGVECPLIVVGERVDVADAYDAGASDVIPLAVPGHAETIADRIGRIVERYWNGRVVTDVLDETNDGVVIHDPDTGEILACNDRFYELLGYDPGTDTIGLEDIADHDEEFTKSRAVSLVQQAAAGTSTTFEWQDPTRDGRDVWVEVDLEATELAGDQYVVASVSDVTERKERERALRDSRKTLQQLHEITADPDLSFDEQVHDLLEFGADQLGMDIGFLARITEAEDHFEIIEARGDHPLIQAGNESALGETYCRRTIDAATDPPLAIRDAETEGMEDDPAYEKFGLGCYLGTEIVVDDALYGTLCFADEEARSGPFTEEEQTLIDHMAQWLAQGLERQEHIREIEQTQQQLERTFERIDDAFFAVDTDWRIRYVNETGADVLRQAMDAEYSEDGLLGRHLWEEIPDAVGTPFYEQYHRAMRDQESVTFEEHYEPLDTWFEVRAYPDDDGLSVYVTDITERKERERELERYGTVLESLDDAVYAIDPDGTIQYVNQKYAQMKGVDQADLIGTNIYDWVDEETARRAEEVRRDIEAKDRNVGVVEYEFESVDGETIPAEMRFALVRDDGEKLGRVGVIRDLTEREETERIRQGLLSTTGDLMDAASREEIAGIVSEATVSVLDHDLNGVYLRSEDGSDLAAAAWSDRVDEMFGGPLSPSEDGPAREALRRGEPVIRSNLVSDTEGDNRYAPVESVLVVPLGTHGVLAVGSTEADAFGQSEVDRARLLTVNAASALDRMDRREELEQYETLFETVRDKLYVIDEDGYFEMVSKPLAETVGYEPETLEGQHVSSIITEETVKDGQRRIVDLLVTPETVSNSYEGTLLTRDGEEIPIEIELSLLPHEDSFRGTVGVVRDISERRRREQELRVFQQAVTEAGVGLAMYGADGRFEYVNDHYAQMLGTTRDTLTGSHVGDIFDAVAAESFETYWDSITPGETRTSETEHRRADGSTVPVEVVTSAVDIDGIEHHILTIQEITDRRERRQQSEVLHRIMRHNLRNNVTVILAHAQGLAERLGAPDAERAETILRMTDRIMNLAETARDAEDLINRDRVRRPVEITAMLREITTDLRGEYDIDIEMDLPDAQHVLADYPLRTALRHALTNAVEHNDAATPKVWVGLSEMPDRAGWISVDIADNGPGIPEGERAMLTSGEETQLQHGSGLGLWIIYWVITRCGGDLAFEERDGGGSIVRLSLPVADPPGESTTTEPDAQTGVDMD